MIYLPSYDNSEWVYLTDNEIDYAIAHGKQMRETSLRLQHKNKDGYHPDDTLALRVQCLGAVAELAVKVALGLDGGLKAEIFREPDLSGNIEVRLIGKNHFGLRIYPKDIEPEVGEPRRVVGVIIEKGRERKHPYRLPGWFAANDEKEDYWWMAPGGGQSMCAVPQEELRPLRELRDLLRSEGFDLRRL